MDMPEPIQPKLRADKWRPLRVWPLLLLLPAMLALRLFRWGEDAPSMVWAIPTFGPILAGIAILAWYLLVSGARWWERMVGLATFVIAVPAVFSLLHESMQGPAMLVYFIPAAIAIFAISLIPLAKTFTPRRIIVPALLAVLTLSSATLLKTDGIWGDFAIRFEKRWAPAPAERFEQPIGLTSNVRVPGSAPENTEADDPGSPPLPPAEWPHFRGPNWDSAVRGVQIATDWTTRPPEELWRIAVGPAWSSFAVAGNYLFTQEQRGDTETVVCYAADSGQEIWSYGVPSRFFDPLGGLGPRSTPTIDGDRVYAAGGEGLVLALDGTSGRKLWEADLKDISSRPPPMWGFAASPYVIGDVVILYAGGVGDKAVVAFSKSDGSVVWTAGAKAASDGSSTPIDSYASVQPLEIGGQTYAALASNVGLTLWDPESGRLAGQYDWKHTGYRALQVQQLDEDQLLLPTGQGSGTRLLKLTTTGPFDAEEVWTSTKLRPDFNDCVVHKEVIYGFDDGIFAAISLADGRRLWKGGRYGKGQVLLVADSDALIVQREDGDVVLVAADPKEHRELGQIDATDSKSWNHPVVVGDRLFVRSADTAVCYRLQQ